MQVSLFLFCSKPDLTQKMVRTGSVDYNVFLMDLRIDLNSLYGFPRTTSSGKVKFLISGISSLTIYGFYLIYTYGTHIFILCKVKNTENKMYNILHVAYIPHVTYHIFYNMYILSRDLNLLDLSLTSK